MLDFLRRTPSRSLGPFGVAFVILGGCGPASGATPPATPQPDPVATATPAVTAPPRTCTRLGPVDGAMLAGIEGRPDPEVPPLEEERILLASGAEVVAEAEGAQVHVLGPVEGWFQAPMASTCPPVVEPWRAPEVTEPGDGRGAAGRVGPTDGNRILDAVQPHANDLDVELKTAARNVANAPDGFEVDAVFGPAPGRFVVVVHVAQEEGVILWTALASFDGVWRSADSHRHSMEELAGGGLDLDGDGLADPWFATDEGDHAFVSIAMTRSRRLRALRVPHDPDRIDGCFVRVDGRMSYVETIARGASAGFRVHRPDDVGESHVMQAGLVGRALVAVAYQRADALRPPSQILDGGEGAEFSERVMRLCPLDGAALDVPGDGHFPVDGHPDVDGFALVRVHALATDPARVPELGGPVIEMHTTSN